METKSNMMTGKDYDIFSIFFFVLFIIYFLSSKATENGMQTKKENAEMLEIISFIFLTLTIIFIYRGIKVHDKEKLPP